MNKDIVMSFAKKLGYDDIWFFTKFNGYNAFELRSNMESDIDNIPVTGLPVFALEKNGKVRMADADENYELFSLYCASDDDDDEDDDDEGDVQIIM